MGFCNGDSRGQDSLESTSEPWLVPSLRQDKSGA
jgi:hypothetical protein